MQNPVRGFLHGAGALLAVIGLIALLVRSEEASMRMAGAVYGLALVSMFTTSALYHAVPWGSDWKSRLQMLDHTFIYVLVAGTATPLLVAALYGGWLAAGLAGIWGLAALGMVQEISKRRTRRTVLALQFVAGAIALIPIASTFAGIDPTVGVLMLAGGVSYLLGTLLFVNSRPRLRPGVFSHHEFFHVVVILASALHFLAVWRIVAL
ncbi:MAG: hemolysin III family protein [Actinobacteria bacterium]|nr:hemolysin III family protein [Actinomycetota bacterium]